MKLYSLSQRKQSDAWIRCTDDERRAIYSRLDPTAGGEGISCADLVRFVEEPNHYDNAGAATVDDTNLVTAVTAALHDEERGVGKLLRRAQATVVEAAQVRARTNCIFVPAVSVAVAVDDAAAVVNKVVPFTLVQT